MKSLRWCAAATALLAMLGGAGAAENAPAQSRGFASLVAKVAPAVVSIANLELAPDQNPLLADPILRQLLPASGIERSLAVSSLGSGVVIDAGKGLIVTNFHVIRNADRLLVHLRDGRKLDARVLGGDEPTDLALLAVEPSGLSGVPLGDSDALAVGDLVLAIGNPFGLGSTVTSGVVSALGRSGLGIEGFEDFIQTDASINPGNSGGALVDTSGALVGINTAALTPSGASIGIGFAIPINMAKRIVAQIAEFGDVQRGQLGVRLQPLTPQLARYFKAGTEHGVVISEVAPDSTAKNAGLVPGDIVTAIDDVAIVEGPELPNRIATMRVGMKATLSVVRDGREITVPITIAKPAIERFAVEAQVPRLAGVLLAQEAAGGGDQGNGALLVLDLRSGAPAWEAGLRAGDLIGEVNRKPVKRREDLIAAAGTGALLLTVHRGDSTFFVLLE